MTAALPQPRFDHFYRYDELTALLFAYAEARPNLVSVRAIGKSYEGRDIWVVVVTNLASGMDIDKPALWMDGNIHAAELTASTTCLYYLHQLLQQHGGTSAQAQQVNRLLDTRTLYIVPRLNPDGAELALADRPRHIRSSTRAYPYTEQPVDGLTVEDIDGDGRILTMRVPDPHGGYKKHAGDPRLMVAREARRAWRRVLPPHPRGLHQAARWPDREGQPRPRGAGPEPQLPRRMAPGVPAGRRGPLPNERARGAGHGRVHHGSPEYRRGGQLPYPQRRHPAPLRHAQRQGHDARGPVAVPAVLCAGERHTGYPAISIYEDFRYHPKDVITGTQDWVYEHLGALFWVVELWSPKKEAGVEDNQWIDWYRQHPVEDDLKLLEVERRAVRRQGACGMDALPASAVGFCGDWRLGQDELLAQPAAGPARARGRALPGLDDADRDEPAQAGAHPHRGAGAGPRHVARAPGRGQCRLPARPT